MTRDQASKNVWRYQAFVTLSIMPFMMPVIVLFWEQNGLDMFQIFLLQAIFAVAIVVLEVPTGMVADLIGKRTSLVVSMAVFGAGMAVYALSTSFAGFLVAELFLSLGLSLYSGAGSALLYDSLQVLGNEGEFPRMFTFVRDVGFEEKGRVGFMVGQTGQILRSTDAGFQWKRVLPPEA